MNAETNPEAEDPLIAPLVCSLVEVHGGLRFEPGSRLRAIYGRDSASEEYHCNYGFSPRYADRLQTGPLKVAARDDEGSVRAVELDRHPFFIGTLFSPSAPRCAIKRRRWYRRSSRPRRPLSEGFARLVDGGCACVHVPRPP